VADEEEWSFQSALPESNGLPTSNQITLTDSVINVTIEASRRSASDPVITLSAKFSSKVPQPITELGFQAAVSKVCFCSQIVIETV
jgi:hypothetical protein